MNEEQQKEFIEKMIKRKENTSFLTFVHNTLNKGEDFRLPPLLDLLMIDSSLLTTDGNDAINYLESAVSPGEKKMSFGRFKDQVAVFLAIQDILSTPIFMDSTNNAILRLKYFYYESKYILNEFVLASLNGLHIGNNHLLRNFIEFNAQQCYFINKIKREQSFQAFNAYLKNKYAPKITTVLKDALPRDDFSKPIKARLQLQLDNLSNRYSHAYSQDDSPKLLGVFRPGLTMESLYFYVQASITLDAVLWMYYVNFPMLFKPVDITKKFGFSPPALFVTPDVTMLVKRTLSQASFDLFKKYAEESEEVKAHLGWYESLHDLTEDEIWAQSDKEKTEGATIEGEYLKMTATVRAYSELPLEAEDEKKERLRQMDMVDDNFVQHLTDFAKWRTIYKNLK